MTTHPFAATSFGFRRQMHQADYAAFHRWYDARCLLQATRADRETTFSHPASHARAMTAMPAPRAEAA